MILYEAAIYTNQYMPGQKLYNDLTDFEKSVIDIPHVLESYHYIHKQKYVDEIRANNDTIFLDSGAFSAHTLGFDIPVWKYCEYVKRNIDIVKVEDGILLASVLDGIGDALQTYKNQLEMEARGVKPLPCFHAGEDEKYLEWYIKNYEYITLGGLVARGGKHQLIMWLDHIWSKYLTDGSGRAKLKVHGFGITSNDIIKRYPWHSCDSSTWIQATSFGNIMTPTHGLICMSSTSPTRHIKGQHVINISEMERELILNEVEKLGFECERLATVYQARAAYNLWSFKQIGIAIDKLQAANDYKMIFKKEGLF